MSLANPNEAQQQSAYEANPICGAPRGQKRPFRPREVWAIRARLEMLGQIRNLALLNLAIDSKLRGCDLVSLKVSDVFSAGSVCSAPLRWSTGFVSLAVST
jgi:hypothetical protein